MKLLLQEEEVEEEEVQPVEEEVVPELMKVNKETTQQQEVTEEEVAEEEPEEELDNSLDSKEKDLMMIYQFMQVHFILLNLIFKGNLSWNTTEMNLGRNFESYGDIKNVKIIED